MWRRAPPRFKGKPDGDNELAEDDDDESTERFGERRDELDEVGDDEDEEDPAEAVDTGSPFELCLRASAFRWAAKSSLACWTLASPLTSSIWGKPYEWLEIFWGLRRAPCCRMGDDLKLPPLDDELSEL